MTKLSSSDTSVSRSLSLMTTSCVILIFELAAKERRLWKEMKEKRNRREMDMAAMVSKSVEVRE